VSVADSTEGLQAMLRRAAVNLQMTAEQVAEQYRTGRTPGDIEADDE
jgi:hypothetical protein